MDAPPGGEQAVPGDGAMKHLAAILFWLLLLSGAACVFANLAIRPDQTLGCDLVIQRIPSGTAGHNLTAPCL